MLKLLLGSKMRIGGRYPSCANNFFEAPKNSKKTRGEKLTSPRPTDFYALRTPLSLPL
jgi:hypothetical protein